MLKNFILTSLRNLRKNGFYSFINIFGLSIGLACSILILLYVADELSFDRYHENVDRIYRVASEGSLGGNSYNTAQVAPPTGPAIAADYPEVAWSTRIRIGGSYIVETSDNNFFKEDLALFADSTLFQTFSFELIEGNPLNALTLPNSVVLSEELAKKYFGDKDALGQTLILDNNYECKVTGVMKKIPTNTHFSSELFISMETLEYSRETRDWTSFDFNTYIVLNEGASAEVLESKFPQMVYKYVGPLVKDYLGITMEEFEAQGNGFNYYLDPVTDIHLYSTRSEELGVGSDIRYIYIFSGIALFILLIACINFMNLSTARSASRAKEVGIRKTAGSRKSQLILQFIFESLFVTSIAFLVAVIISFLTLPYFNQLSGKELSIPFSSFSFYLLLLSGIVIVSLMAGSYPAFFLSAFKPVDVLKGKLKTGMKSGRIRSALVIFQFAISILLIAGTLVIYNQLQFIQNKNLGYSKDQVIVVNDSYVLEDNIESFKTGILQIPEVQNASMSSYLPVRSSRSSSGYFPKGSDPNQNLVVLNHFYVDSDYISTLQIEMLDGRNFSPEILSDSTALIVNEAFVKELGFDNPIGKVMSRFTDDPNVVLDFNIIGVMKDFHYESLRSKIEPLMFRLGRSTGRVSVRVNTTDLQQTISKIEGEWTKAANGEPFEYTFVDDLFNNMYNSEKRTGRIALAFASLAIFIAALGLFALSSFTAEQRSKEIGVRKVLGASIGSIILLLSKEYGKLILVSLVISIPLAWYFMNQWLQDFEYKTNLHPGIFLGAGFLAISIAWFSMGFQSWKAAAANPARSLRNE